MFLHLRPIAGKWIVAIAGMAVYQAFEMVVGDARAVAATPGLVVIAGSDGFPIPGFDGFGGGIVASSPRHAR